MERRSNRAAYNFETMAELAFASKRRSGLLGSFDVHVGVVERMLWRAKSSLPVTDGVRVM